MAAGKELEGINHGRRRLLGAAGAVGAAAATAGLAGSARAAVRGTAEAGGTAGGGAGALPVFGPVKQVRAGVLNTGYVEVGPADGPAVICMHGWPYDIHSYAEVAPLLAAEGYRVIVPYFRGHGTTTFLSGATPAPPSNRRSPWTSQR